MRSSFLKQYSPLFLLSAISLIAAGNSLAQTLTITGGQGQIVVNASAAGNALTVQLLDGTGKPFPNQVITFQDTQGGTNGIASPTSVTTDSNGMASTTFIAPNIPTSSGVSYVQTTVLASYGGLVATFYETTSAITSTGGNTVQPFIQSPVFGQVLRGGAGSAGSVPITVIVNSILSSQGIPNVAVSLQSDTTQNATVGCKEGPYVLTDATGTATCTPLFGKVGSGSFAILVGGRFFQSLPFQFTTTVGPPGIITISSGDNQAGVPGQRLPAPIVAVVTDLAGNVVQGAQVVFETIPAGAATFTNVVSTSDPNGRVSANVVLGTTPGPFQIRIRDVGNLVANPPLLTATVNITISGLNKISGDGQTAFIGAQFGQPLVVQVNQSTNQPVASAMVTFTVTSGSASVSPTTVLTDGGGRASTTVTAGGIAGPITITATSGNFSQTFSLTANPPGPTNFTYSNGASFATNYISPGSIVTINAQGLVSGNVQGVVGGTLVGALPYTVAGVSVTIDNIPAPIYNVSNVNGAQAVTVQIPFEVRPTTVPVTISVTGGGSTSAFVTVLPVAPGIFETVGSDNQRRVVALRPNGTVVTTTNPARRGENVRVYLTGLGPVTPSVPTGALSPSTSDPQVAALLVAGINGIGVPVVQTVYARNLIGVYEMTVTIPTDPVAFPAGTDTFLVAVYNSNGTYTYSQISAIAIQ